MALNKKNLLKMVRHMWTFYKIYRDQSIKGATVITFMREFLGEYESNVL